MKSEVHGINCTCCESKSKEAKELLDEINKILNEANAEEVLAPKQAVIKKAKEIESLFTQAISISDYEAYPEIPVEERFPGTVDPEGKMSQLTKLVEKLFSLPDGDVNFEAVKITEPEKKVGKFKITEITENPNIDVTKVMDLSGIDLNAFSKLKIAITIPTIDAVLGFKFGPIQLGINFKIGVGTFAWSPDVKFNSIQEALDNLKGSTYKKLLSESGPEDLEELQELAKSQFSGVPSVKSALKNTKDKQEFFDQVQKLGVNIVKDVDVEKEALAIFENEKQIRELIASSVVGLPEPEKTTPSEIGKVIGKCADTVPKQAAYREEEVQKIHDETCKVEAPAGDAGDNTGTGAVGASIASDGSVVVNYPNTELPSQEGELTKVQDVLSEVDAFSQQMQNCAKQKGDASNKWYAFYSHSVLHKITVQYFDRLLDHINFFNNQLIAIIRERDAIIADSTDYTSLVNGFYLNSDDFLADANTLSWTSESGVLTISNDDLSAVRTQFDAYRNDLNDLSGGTIQQIRQSLNIDNNPLSNLVGYLPNQFNQWCIKAPGVIKITATDDTYYDIRNRCQELWQESINTPTITLKGLVAGVSEPLINYIIPIDVPQYAEGLLVKDRSGLFEVGIWKPFYSAKRIDYFFTYQEQGYTQPKPEFNDNGEMIGTKVNKVIKNGLEEEVIVEVPAASEDLKSNDEVIQDFLENLEQKTRDKVINKVEEIENSPAYINFINVTLDQAAKREAARVFFDNIENRGFLEGTITLYSISHINDFARKASVARTYYEKLQKELQSLDLLMESCQLCVDENIANIESTVKKLGTGPDGGDSTNLEKECKDRLGSDPVGQKPADGRCPTYIKNCYWKEYTKIMQKVSVLPVPELDPPNFGVRLFRYYPVAIQFPIPPIPAIPTLALGAPDPLVSIPLPLLWKHIITIDTPIGTIVTWIAFAGFIPAPFIMLIDEKGEATFMITSRGPCSIPHPTVAGFNPLEEKSLLDILLPPSGIKINLSSPLGKLLVGNANNDIANADSGKNIIDKLKEKIKSSYSQLEIPDPPSIGGNSEAAKAKRQQIKKAFEDLPPNPAEIETALDEVFSAAVKAIDGIKVNSIKFPKDDKKLLLKTLGPGEIMDNLNKAIDTVTSAPAEIQNELLKALGVGIPTINVKKKLREQVLQQVDTPNVRNFFRDLDAEIDELEARLSFDTTLDEKVRERAKIIKKLVKKPLEEAAKKINPEILGFVSKTVDGLILPFPCYTNIQLPVVPPYIYVLIAAFKAAPSIIDALPLESIANLVSFELDLTGTLPSAERLFYNTINGLLDAVPELVLPDPESYNMLKQTIDMVKQIPFKFKVPLPGKIGLPSQIVIPGSLIKTLMKEAAKIAFDAIKATIMGKIYEAIASNNVQKLIAVSLIVKAIFGVGLSEIKGSDIKSFIGGVLDSTIYPALDGVSSIINAINALGSFPFLSIIELFQFPPKLSLPGKDGPFFDVSWELLKPLLDPIINSVLPLLFNNTPLIVKLLACSSSPARLAFTKLHPTKPLEKLPTWEGLSDKNVPFVIWLDQLVATAQRKSGLGSTYLSIPFGYQALP